MSTIPAHTQTAELHEVAVLMKQETLSLQEARKLTGHTNDRAARVWLSRNGVFQYRRGFYRRVSVTNAISKAEQAAIRAGRDQS